LLRKEVLADILVRKGVDLGLVRIIFEYLSNRYGFVQIDQFRSCVREIKVGCVQGSILGPFLFNVYTSELQSIVSPYHLVSYADDSYVTISDQSSESLIDKFKEVFSRHNQWLNGIGMICNKTKTELIIMGDDTIKEIELEDGSIAVSEKMKVLGMWLDKDLKWTHHVEYLIKKCRALGFGMRYLNKHLNMNEMKRVFHSHFISKITFGSPVWHNAINFHLRAKLRSIYYKQIRIIVRDFEFKLNRGGLLKRLGVPNLDLVFFRRDSVFLFNVMTNVEPDELVARLMASAHFNERSYRVVFFRDYTSRMFKSNVVYVANQSVQRWNFNWLEMTKETFKEKLKEINDVRLF